MGNLYYVTEDLGIYSHCGDVPEGKAHVMVHGWRNLEKIMHRLKNGADFLEIAERVCSRCGGFAENGSCGCGKFDPQLKGNVIRYRVIGVKFKNKV